MAEGSVNRNFDAELRQYELSWKPNTSQYQHRQDYPGAALLDHTCPRYDCVAYTGDVKHDTYYICSDCAKLAPCTVATFHQAPYKIKPPLKKRRMANAISLSVYFRTRYKS